MTVVDASVVIKWFVNEPGSDAAREVLRSDALLCAPSHLVGEVARGLLRRRRAGDLASDDAMQALAGLSSIVTLAPMDSLGPLAFDIAERASITVYDALYVALAAQRDDVLITADSRLCDGLQQTPWAGRAQRLSEHAALRSPKQIK